MAGMRDPSLGTYGMNPFAAGRKQYGGGTTYSPTMGQVDRSGYKDREMRNKAKRDAMLKYLQDRQSGSMASAAALKMGQR